MALSVGTLHFSRKSHVHVQSHIIGGHIECFRRTEYLQRQNSVRNTKHMPARTYRVITLPHSLKTFSWRSIDYLVLRL